MSEKVFSVLFLCADNSTLSIVAEVQLNALGKGRFKAFSAGLHPNGAVSPLAIEVLQRARLPTDGLRSKSWDEFLGPGARVMDYVLTVGDQAANEEFPYWPGQPSFARWPMRDPAATTGTADEMRRAFGDTARALRRRIELLTVLPIAVLDRMSIKKSGRAQSGMQLAGDCLCTHAPR